MHVRDARKHGVSEQKLDVLAAWEEAGGLFSARERAALALTEAITELGDGHVPDQVYARAAAVFTERELAQVIAMAVTISVEPYQRDGPPRTPRHRTEMSRRINLNRVSPGSTKRCVLNNAAQGHRPGSRS
jgi:hypothetical protein